MCVLTFYQVTTQNKVVDFSPSKNFMSGAALCTPLSLSDSLTYQVLLCMIFSLKSIYKLIFLKEKSVLRTSQVHCLSFKLHHWIQSGSIKVVDYKLVFFA